MVAHRPSLLRAEEVTMLHVYICPDCRSEHAEPAEAHFLLAVSCVDCAFEVEYRASRFAGVEIPAAA